MEDILIVFEMQESQQDKIDFLLSQVEYLVQAKEGYKQAYLQLKGKQAPLAIVYS